MRKLALLLATLALAGCASARLPAETPAGAALDVAESVHHDAGEIMAATKGHATPARIQQLLADAAQAQSEARRSVPSFVAAKGPLLAAAGATSEAAHALTHPGGAAAARAGVARAQLALAKVADAVEPHVPGRPGAVALLRTPLG